MPDHNDRVESKRIAVRRCKTPEAAHALEAKLRRYEGKTIPMPTRVGTGTADQLAKDTGGAGNEAWQKLNELDRESLAKLKLLAEKLDSPLFKALYLLAKGTK